MNSRMMNYVMTTHMHMCKDSYLVTAATIHKMVKPRHLNYFIDWKLPLKLILFYSYHYLGAQKYQRIPDKTFRNGTSFICLGKKDVSEVISTRALMV